MIRNIIFDWSGTLSNSVNSFYQLCQIMFRRLGHKGISLEEIRREFTLPYMTFWNKYFPDLKKDEQDKLYSEIIHQVDKAELYPGVKEVLHRLKSLNIRMYVVSSDLYSTLLPEAKKGEVNNLFEEIIGEIHEKEEVLLNLIQKYGLNPDDTLYIGDTFGDIEAGKKAGLRTAGITWGFQNEERLKQANPDYVIRNISELENLREIKK